MGLRMKWGAAVAALVVAMSGTALAQSPAETPTEAGAVDCAALEAAEIAAINAEEAEFAAALDAAGIPYETVTEDGITWVELDEDDPAVEAALDDLFAEYEKELAECDEFFLEKLTDEEKAELNAEEAELAAALDAAGVPYETVTKAGVTWVELDEDDPAAEAAVDEFFAQFDDDCEDEHDHDDEPEIATP